MYKQNNLFKLKCRKFEPVKGNFFTQHLIRWLNSLSESHRVQDSERLDRYVDSNTIQT